MFKCKLSVCVRFLSGLSLQEDYPDNLLGGCHSAWHRHGDCRGNGLMRRREFRPSNNECEIRIINTKDRLHINRMLDASRDVMFPTSRCVSDVTSIS
jgi:hypothetical protein